MEIEALKLRYSPYTSIRHALPTKNRGPQNIPKVTRCFMERRINLDHRQSAGYHASTSLGFS